MVDYESGRAMVDAINVIEQDLQQALSAGTLGLLRAGYPARRRQAGLGLGLGGWNQGPAAIQPVSGAAPTATAGQGGCAGNSCCNAGGACRVCTVAGSGPFQGLR